jgi:hypothetical protein
VRKLSPEERLQVVEHERQVELARAAFGPPDDAPAPGQDERLELSVGARVGDVVTLREGDGGELSGVLLRVIRDGERWVALQLLAGTGRRWLTNGTLAANAGRAKGISRIDHPARRTHGWYVRMYAQGKVQDARLFSDGRYGGASEALEAALAFQKARGRQ